MSSNLPDTLYAKIRVKRSVIPGELPGSLDVGEVAINIPDKKIYIGDDSGNTVEIFQNIEYAAGLGIEITNNQISFDPSDNFFINVSKISPAGASGSASGFLYWNGTVWSIQIPNASFEQMYLPGSGLELSSDNVFSVNLNTVTEGTLSIDLVAPQGMVTGFLKWESGSWNFVPGETGPQGPAGPAGTDGISITDASINPEGRLIIFLSNGQSIDAGVVTASGFGQEYFAGNGLELNSNNEFSVNLNTIESGSLDLARLDSGSANLKEFLEWDGQKWNPSGEISGGSANSFSS